MFLSENLHILKGRKRDIPGFKNINFYHLKKKTISYKSPHEFLYTEYRHYFQTSTDGVLHFGFSYLPKHLQPQKQTRFHL